MGAERTTTMSKAELEALPEYSTTVPTGVCAGKRWRRNQFAAVRWLHFEVCGIEFRVPAPKVWWLGEYVPVADDERAFDIRWSKVEVES